MIKRRKEKKRFKRRVLIISVLAALLFLVVCLVYLFRGRYWDGVHNLNLAVNGQGKVYIVSFDPENNEITRIIIPGDTKMELIGNRGFMKVGNIWQLGRNEKLGGSLLAGTLTKNLRMAVYTWVNEGSEPFWGLGSETNLSFGDRLGLALFNQKVKAYKKQEVDLSKTTFLAREENGGDGGYLLSGRTSRVISVTANDPRLSENRLKVKIINLTGSKEAAEEFGKIIESLGAKVTLIEGNGEGDSDCLIYSNSKEVNKFLKNTFSCRETRKLKDSNFDIEIVIGKAFSRRF